MKKIVVIVALCLATLAGSAHAGAAPRQFSPSPQDKQDLVRIESYLNALKSMSADFLQIDDAGNMRRGVIAISRPGKMRVDYAPPSKDFIIADGSSLHIWNDDLQEQTNLDQGSSLAEFILRDPIKMDSEVYVSKIERRPARIEVTLEQSRDPGAGSLTLAFEDHPLKLRQWTVVDSQGRTTGVNLENLSEGVTLPENIFIFTPPNFGKSR